MAPVAFLSYSHDSKAHKDWVLGVYRDFSDDREYDTKLEELVHELRQCMSEDRVGLNTHGRFCEDGR